jgi:hypothetical protein
MLKDKAITQDILYYVTFLASMECQSRKEGLLIAQFFSWDRMPHFSMRQIELAFEFRR